MEQNQTLSKISTAIVVIGNTLSWIVIQYILLIAKYHFRSDAIYIALYAVSINIAWNYWDQLKRQISNKLLRFMIVILAFAGIALLAQFGEYH